MATMIITLDGERITVDVDGNLSALDPRAADNPRARRTEPTRDLKRPTHGYIGLQNHDPGDVVGSEVSVLPLVARSSAERSPTTWDLRIQAGSIPCNGQTDPQEKLAMCTERCVTRQCPALAGRSTAFAAADTYFVAPHGDDSHAGTESQPWKTVRKAAAAVQLRHGAHSRLGTISWGQRGSSTGLDGRESRHLSAFGDGECGSRAHRFCRPKNGHMSRAESTRLRLTSQSWPCSRTPIRSIARATGLGIFSVTT